MLTSDFSVLELADCPIYAPYWQQTPVRSADYTFTNLWGWGVHYGLEWKLAHNLCWIRQQPGITYSGMDPIYWAPVGNWNIDWTAIPEIVPGMVMKRVPEALCQILKEQFQDRIVIEETRGQWEYLYEQEALSTLRGNKLHKKRNHVNGFIKAYGQDYRPITLENLSQVLDLQSDWCKWHECEKSASLLAESDVTYHILKNWAVFPNLVGGALFAEDRMIAFSVGEPLDDETMVVHFEKGRPDYRGVYQAINYFFAGQAAGYKYLNREQDAGEDGLRQAKESYFPCDFLVKNTVTFL